MAVKVLLGHDDADVARFEREAQVLSELSHPGIVRYVAQGVSEAGQLYLVMEWLDGEDLESRLHRTGLSVDESIQLAMHVAEALGRAHRQGIVHRDLKPSNLFLVQRQIERVKLLDFGVAQLGGVTQLTRTGVLVGTPGYMSPEQARGEQEIGPRSDVFALGCVLFECLTGAPLFRADHVVGLLAKILFEEVPRVREIRPEIAQDIDALVARMLSKEPDDRPRDAAALLEALRGLGTAETPLAPPEPLHQGPAALTGSEQRAVFLVLIGKEQVTDSAQAITFGTARTLTAVDPLRKEGERYGGRLEPLADGSMIVAITADKVATDQAAQAARCALSLRMHAGRRPMALAAGRGERNGRRPAGEAVDRLTKMLWMQPPPMSAGGADLSGPIAIDEVTAALLDARFRVVENEYGFWLHGEREVAEGARTLLGKPTACVGRDRELAMLEQAFAECAEEDVAHAVLVTAPAGMGKSRLSHELLARIRQRSEPVAIWMGRGDSLRAGSSFGLLGQALRGAWGIREGEPLEIRRSKLQARVDERIDVANRRRVADFLGEMIGTPMPDDDSLPLREARRDAQLMGDQMRRAWEDFLCAECTAQPVLLVLEDLHWGDLPTVRFIDKTLHHLRHKPWMVLALARPEVHDVFPKLWADRNTQEIRLSRLSRKASERLVCQVLGDAVGQDTVNRLVAQADGNAFYLEELIRATAEQKGGVLPETVVAMVESRLGTLEGQARRLLRAASIFGEVFWSGGLSPLLGGAGAHEWLASLVAREVLVQRWESRFPSEKEFAFRHALLREGAYAMLTEQDRTLGHRLAGQWLEQHGENDPMVLAEHFERGGEPARAGSYYVRAAEQAIRGRDADGAIARARRGLECGVPEDLRLALLGTLCEAHGWRNEWSTTVPYAAEVMALSPPGSARWAQGAAMKLFGDMVLGNQEEFMRTLSVARDVEPFPDAVTITAFALGTITFALNSAGHFAVADTTLASQSRIVEPVVDHEPMAAGWMYATRSHRAALVEEDPFRGLELARTAQAHFQKANHLRGVAIARVLAARDYWSLGAIEKAEPELDSVENPEDVLGGVFPIWSFVKISILAERHRFDEAIALACRIIEAMRLLGLRLDEGRAHWALAEALRRKGDLDEAEREIVIALEQVAAAEPDSISATATRAAIQLAQGRAPEALATAQDAVARYESLGACAFFRGAQLRLVHAEALEAASHRQAARAAIAAARAHIVTHAAKIGDPDLYRIFLEDVHEHTRTFQLAQEWLGEDNVNPT